MDRYIGPLDNHEEVEVGRMLKNAFGIEECIVMPVCFWKYFDWLVEIGTDMDEWVKNRDLERHSHSYGDFKFQFPLQSQIKHALLHSERRRYLNGENIPLFIKPSGYHK